MSHNKKSTQKNQLTSNSFEVILFELSPDGINDRCVIVEIAKECGNKCNIEFPKGICKKIKGTKIMENIHQGALRGLREETGIDFSQITLANVT